MRVTRCLLRIIAEAALPCLLATTATAQFATVIDVPPNASGTSIGSNTQLNVLAGGSLPPNFAAGPADGTGQNIEVNVHGGMLGRSFDANSGATVNIFSGVIEQYYTGFAGSTTNIYGGKFGSYPSGAAIAESGSVFRVAGGNFYNGLLLRGGSYSTIAGGAFDYLNSESGASLLLRGSDYQLNGTPIGGLQELGNRVSLNLASRDILTGVFADGTPFALSPLMLDTLPGGVLTLEAADVASIVPAVIDASVDSVPLGIRQGQRLIVGGSSSVDHNFRAGAGSVVEVSGTATVGRFLEAIDASVIVSGGYVDLGFSAMSGSEVHLSGGHISSWFQSFSSTVHVSGGTLFGEFFADDSVVDISGGDLRGSQIYARRSSIAISAVVVDRIELMDASELEMSGGTANYLSVLSTAKANLVGGRFNGLKVAKGAEVTVAGASVPNSSTTQVEGTLNITAGGVGRITAENGSIVNISGGTLGFNSRAIKSAVNVSGGAISTGFRVETNSKVTITGGSIGEDFRVMTGSTVRMEGGAIGRDMSLQSGTTLTLTGGTIGPSLLAGGATLNISGGSVGIGSQVNNQCVVNLSGGKLDDNFQLYQSTLNFTGGTIGDGLSVSRSNGQGLVELRGGNFRLNGQLVTSSAQLENPTGLVSGVLADGTPFCFWWGDNDNLDGGLRLRNTLLPPAADSHFVASSGLLPKGLRNGQSLTVDPGGSVPADYNAEFNNQILVEAGGAVGKNLEIIGGRLTIAGGAVGDALDAHAFSTIDMSGGSLGGLVDLNQSTLNLSGGDVGVGLTLRSGATANISGGRVGSVMRGFLGGTLNVSGGEIGSDAILYGQVNVSGGRVGDRFEISNGAQATISGGAFGGAFESRYTTLTFVGSDFRLSGTPIAGLNAPGDFVELELFSEMELYGLLADGTPINLSWKDGDIVLDKFRLEFSAPPVAGPAFIDAATDPLPIGIHAGQTLRVGDGGIVPKDFQAGRGSSVVVEHGGVVGSNLEAAGANIFISGGEIAAGFDAFAGTTVTIHGGSIGEGFQVFNGATVEIIGGNLDNWFAARAGSTVRFSVVDFFINGEQVDGFDVSETIAITERDITISGLYQDGTEFSFFVRSEYGFAVDQSATLEITRVGLPGDFNNDGFVDAADYSVWRDGLGSTYTQAAYEMWRSHFGLSLSVRGASSLTVPEPSIAATLLAALAISFASLRPPIKTPATGESGGRVCRQLR